MDRFQRERILLPPVPDNWATIAFARNLNEESLDAARRLKESLREFHQLRGMMSTTSTVQSSE